MTHCEFLRITLQIIILGWNNLCLLSLSESMKMECRVDDCDEEDDHHDGVAHEVGQSCPTSGCPVSGEALVHGGWKRWA